MFPSFYCRLTRQNHHWIVVLSTMIKRDLGSVVSVLASLAVDCNVTVIFIFHLNCRTATCERESLHCNEEHPNLCSFLLCKALRRRNRRSAINIQPIAIRNGSSLKSLVQSSRWRKFIQWAATGICLLTRTDESILHRWFDLHVESILYVWFSGNPSKEIV